MIFRDKKIIFFHVPKVAGYSIEQFLSPGDRDYRIFNEDVLFGIHNKVMTQHLTYNGMKNYVDEATLNSYYKFAFFRNTWERLVSAYTYLEPANIKRHGNFENCIKWACKKAKSNDYSEGWHFGKQTDYLYKNKINGDLALDYVGQYEKLDTDLKEICKIINIPYTQLKSLNVSKLRTKPHKDYYTPELVELVRETYKDEIDYFKYTF